MLHPDNPVIVCAQLCSRELASPYGCDRPQASHFRLWQPEHEYYLNSVVTNSIDDILKGFKGHGMANQLIDLIPGDSWNTKNNEITRQWEDRELIYNPKYKYSLSYNM